MKRNYYYIAALLVAALFASCAGKIGELSSDYVEVVPSPLELKAGKVDAAITAKFPPKYFAKKAILKVTPVLVSADGKEIAAESVSYQGEKVKGNDQVIPYKEGGVVTQNASFDYVDGFEKSELYLDLEATIGKKTQKLPRVKVADGVIITPTLVTGKSLTPTFAEDKFQKSVEQAIDAQVLFVINKYDIRDSEKKNLTNFLKKLAATTDSTANQALKGVEVQAYASPDGAEDLNSKLAGSREKATVDYLKAELKKQKLSALGNSVSSKFTAEDWDGFKTLVEKSNIQEKQTILSILQNTADPEKREQEIKKLSSVFDQLATDILPQLRRSKLKLTVDVLGKSDAEIVVTVKKDIKSLNAEELLYGATLTTNAQEKATIYQAVVDQFPNDWRGYNNLGAIKFQQGDYAGATSLFEKALSISSLETKTNYNLGIATLATGKDYAKAASYLDKGKGGVPEADYKDAQALIQISKGSYSAAATSVDKNNSNVAALTQILTANYNKANATLAAVQNPDATTDYLKAVVGARTANKQQVIDGLKAAITKDKSLAKKALTDVEFAKFATDADFLSIVK
ncbi:MAG: hypothetical protein LBN27_05570 [Prevotellaceae bacterium]|jgi:Flp pilus assembly protein TadD|nr:hypothetical protein [Prevotellaceae bacterium]